MKAVVLREEKDFEKLVLAEMPRPVAGRGEVVVRIKAAALNHRDVWIVRGLYPNISVPIIPGSDGAGEVGEIGAGVNPAWRGKKVIINPSLDWGNDPRVQQKNYRILGLPDHGTHAEFVKIPAENLTRKPPYLSFEEAAALPLAGLTGYRALFVKGKLIPGETIFITGIGGGVAALMLQMAVAAGARVLVSSGSSSKLEKAMQAGAAGGVNYTEKNWARNLAKVSGGAGIDLIVDGAGGKEFNQLISLVKPAGRIVVYGATAGNPEQIDLRKIFWKQISIRGSTMGNQQDFDRMVKFCRKHKIKPIISHIYPLAGYKKAYLEMMQGKQFGKIVLVP